MTHRSKKAAARLMLATIVIAAAAGALAAWIRFPERDSNLDARATKLGPGTIRMVARLRSARDAAERDTSLPNSQSGEDTWRVNRPWTIPALQDAVKGAKLLDEHLTYRHRLLRELLWSGQNVEALVVCREVQAIVDTTLAGRMNENELKGLRAMILREQVAVRLRMAEWANCVCENNSESCIFPLAGGGLHGRRQAAHDLVKDLETLIAIEPKDLSWRWLLNLAHMTLGEYPQGVPPEHLIPESAFASEHDIGVFKDEAVQRGAGVVGLAGGCVLEDLDGDGDLDLIVSGFSLRDQLTFLRNRGDGTFENHTKEAGLEGIVGGLNLSHADYDNDGDADILVLRGGWEGDHGTTPHSLLRSNGDGTFEDVTEEAGLLLFHPGQVGVWGDYDNDGWLDLFLGHEDRGDGKHPSYVFRNDRDGTFSIEGRPSGLPVGFVKGAAWGDYDNDGLIDLYISRMGAPNVLLRNDGPTGTSESETNARWRFRETTPAARVPGPVSSFATWFFDYDNDGFLDIFAAGFRSTPVGDVAALYLGEKPQGELSRLYRNRGDGTFDDVTQTTRLDRLLLVMGTSFGDLDNDGWLDLYAGTGAPNLLTLVPNRMFRNAGGRSFQDVTTSGGFGHLQKGHGIAFGDVDGDGDQDVYAVQGGWYSADHFRNLLFMNPGHGNHWIKLRLRGTRTNRMALGARIRVRFRENGRERTVHDVVSTGGSFGSTTALRHIGVGRADGIDSIEVDWPTSGHHQVLENVKVNQTIEIIEEAPASEAKEG